MKILIKTIIVFFLVLPASAGGVANYAGSSSSAGAAVSDSSGSSASAVINMDFKVPIIIANGVYDTNGVNVNSIFSSPNTNFPARTNFTAAESGGMLIADENDLKSKFVLDLGNILDASAILGHIANPVNVPSQDLVIKGAVFTNVSSLNISVTTSTNVLTLTGGTGSAPQISLRAVGGIPGGGSGAIATQTAPALGLILDNSKRTSLGYARYAIIADFQESTVTGSTAGSWNGGFTVTVTGI